MKHFSHVLPRLFMGDNCHKNVIVWRLPRQHPCRICRSPWAVSSCLIKFQQGKKSDGIGFKPWHTHQGKERWFEISVHQQSAKNSWHGRSVDRCALVPVVAEIWDVTAPIWFPPRVSWWLHPQRERLQGNGLSAWPVDSVKVVPVSLGCSCLPQDWQWPPMVSDSLLPTALFHGRTWGTGIWVSAVVYEQVMKDLRLCTRTSWLLWQEEQWYFCANKNGRAEDSSFPHDLPGHQGWNHCSARPVMAPAHFSVKSDRLD